MKSKKYFRVVYNARAGGKMFRGPNAEMVVDAETFEAALRAVRASVRFEGKYHFGVPGETEFIRVEPSTLDDHTQFLQDSLAGHGEYLQNVARGKPRKTSTPMDNERQMAERRRQRKLKSFRPLKGGRRS